MVLIRTTPLALAVLMSVALHATDAQVVSNLPSSITTADGQLDGGQTEQVNRYIAAWALSENDTPTTISAKRKKLREPLLRPGSSPSFKAQYSARVATALEPVMRSDRELIRLNAMIVVASLQDSNGLDLARRGVGDKSAAVRFWAAKSLVAIVKHTPRGEPVLSEPDRVSVLRAIAPVVNKEDSADIRQQMYIVLAQLDLADARATLLQAFNSWVRKYVDADASADLRAESRGIGQLSGVLFKAFVRNRDGNVNPIKAELKALAMVGYQYAQLIARDIDKLRADDEALAVARDMVSTIERLLNQTRQAYDSSSQSGPAISKLLSDGKYAEFAWQVGEWKDKLTGPPLSIPENLLPLPQRTPGETAAQPAPAR